MERAALALDITGHIDGHAVWFVNDVVEVFTTFDDACSGFNAAQWATLELERVLSRREAA